MINKITSPKLDARMPEILALGGGAMEVLHTRHLLYMSSYFSETESGSPNMEVPLSELSRTTCDSALT